MTVEHFRLLAENLLAAIGTYFDAVGTTITGRRRVGPGNFTPSLSQNRA
jgi:hypothetical protein